MLPRTIDIKNKKVFLIDQTKLPKKLEIVEIKSLEEMYTAIQIMIVRGAPAIGVAAAAGMALKIESMVGEVVDSKLLLMTGEYLKTARPTAVNLAWAVDKVLDFAKGYSLLVKLKTDIWRFVEDLANQDELINRAMGKNGADVLTNKNLKIITHCNAGSLATVYWGTALGVIRELFNREQIEMVYADETRPRLQGGKLTSWELMEDNVPVTVMTDNMAAYLMSKEKIDAVIVGADRIALNGNAANKIGTYSLAISANFHGVPFYVAAPISTIDFTIKSGKQIIIEERDQQEVTHIDDISIMPRNVKTINPSFDVTPAKLITGIITEKRVLTGDLGKEIKSLISK